MLVTQQRPADSGRIIEQHLRSRTVACPFMSHRYVVQGLTVNHIQFPGNRLLLREEACSGFPGSPVVLCPE